MKGRTGAVVVTAAQLGRQAGTALLFVFLARLISPESFGVVALALVFVNFFVLCADLGSEPMIARLSQGGAAAYASKSILRTVPIAAAVSILLWFGSSLIGTLLGKPAIAEPLAFMSLAIPIASCTAVLRGYCSAVSKYAVIGVSEIGGLIAGATLAVLLALNGLPILALTAQFVGANAASATSYVFFATSSILRERKWQVDCAWRPSLAFAGFTAINYWSRNADNLLVGRFLGTYSLGLYERAYQLMYVPASQLSGAFGRVMVPHLASCLGDPRRVLETYTTAVGAICLTALPFLVGVSSLADPLSIVVFGERWAEMGPVLAGLAAAGSVQAASSSVGWLYQAKGAGREFLRNGLVFSGLTIVGIGMGLLTGTVAGVAWVYFLTTCILTIPIFVAAFRVVSIPPKEFFGEMYPVVVAAVLQWGLSRWWMRWVGYSNIVALMLGGIAGCVVFVGFVTLMRPRMVRRVLGVRRELSERAESC